MNHIIERHHVKYSTRNVTKSCIPWCQIHILCDYGGTRSPVRQENALVRVGLINGFAADTGQRLESPNLNSFRPQQ